MPSLNRATTSRVMSWLVIGVLGAVEGIYGRARYLGDAISYLNVSRAVSALDWQNIFDSMWSPGYPVLVAAMRGMFPSTPEGEWHAITFLNWLIFLTAYGCWRYLIRQAIEFRNPSEMNLRDHPVVLWTGVCAFLSCNLCLDNVSSVGPDLLVTTLFILAAAQTLSLLTRPSIVRAIGLGLTLGAGSWVKGVFMAFACIFLLILLLAHWPKKRSLRILGVSSLVYLTMLVPFVAAISISYGQFTLGASGALNYAFHVNHMPHWVNWQGGPTQFGVPLHPTRQLISGLPVFEFSTPFRSTYPPYNNMAYWYQGSVRFHSVRLQLLAFKRTFHFLAGVLKMNPFLWALAFTFLALLLVPHWRISSLALLKLFWPLFLPAALGLATYLSVHVEDRYLSALFLILSMFPLLCLLSPSLKSRRALLILILAGYTAGAAAQLAIADSATFRAAMQGRDFHRDAQWELAMALPSYGLQNGDAVAVIDGESPAYRCHWAYVSKLRIVAEFGSLPWAIAPWDRMGTDHIVAEPADQDYGVSFWQKITPRERMQVINAFHAAGAKAIVELSRPAATPQPGWQQVLGTNAWIYRFAGDQAAASARP